MKRGEVWVGAGPNYVSKPRPVIVIQDDAFAELQSVTVLPVTSVETESTLLRVSVLPSKENGLRAPSFAMVDKVTTVRREQLVSRLGVITPAKLAKMNQALMVFLGLTR